MYKKNLIQTLEKEQINQFNIKKPFFYKPKIGDIILVRTILSKKQKRQQTFVGICISYKNKDLRSSFVLRNLIHKELVDKSFSFFSSLITDIQIIKKETNISIRRAKLYYLNLNKTI